MGFFDYYKEIFSLALQGTGSFILSKIKEEIISVLVTFICLYVFYEKGKADVLEQSTIKTIFFIIIYLFILFGWNLFYSPVKLNKSKEGIVKTLEDKKGILDEELKKIKEKTPYFVIEQTAFKFEKNDALSVGLLLKNNGEDSINTKYTLISINDKLSNKFIKSISNANVIKKGEVRRPSWEVFSFNNDHNIIYFIFIVSYENKFKRNFTQIKYMKWQAGSNGRFPPELFEMYIEEKDLILETLGDTLIDGKRLIDIDKESIK